MLRPAKDFSAFKQVLIAVYIRRGNARCPGDASATEQVVGTEFLQRALAAKLAAARRNGVMFYVDNSDCASVD